MFMVPCILVILVLIKYQRDATFSVYLGFYNSTCFGRSLRPSSGVILQSVVAATGMYHRYGVSESRVEVIGSVYYIPWYNRC